MPKITRDIQGKREEVTKEKVDHYVFAGDWDDLIRVMCDTTLAFRKLTVAFEALQAWRLYRPEYTLYRI